MKLAIASQNKKQVTGHAGQCRNYWVFDFSGSKAVGRTMVQLERNQTFHQTGGSMVPALEGIDVLISGGMGSALVRRLAERSIRSFVTDETDIDRVLVAFANGTLVEVQPEPADSDHELAASHDDHGGGCGCSHR